MLCGRRSLCIVCIAPLYAVTEPREWTAQRLEVHLSRNVVCVFLAFMSYDTLVQQCPHHHTTPLPLAHGTLQETVRGYEPLRSPDNVRVFNKEHETFELLPYSRPGRFSLLCHERAPPDVVLKLQ